MVKNKTGGNKAKKFGRKHVMMDEPQNVKVRFVEEDGEMYGIVSKIFGQGQLEVMCYDGRSRHGVLRKKFRGRYKHENKISIGTWIMIGLRDWQSNSHNENKKEHCDVLEVYNDDEKQKLIQLSRHNLKSLMDYEISLMSFDSKTAGNETNIHNNMSTATTTANNRMQDISSSIVFSNYEESDDNMLFPPINEKKVSSSSNEHDDNNDYGDIDFDDI